MSKQTNEHAFETQVEETLLGVSGWQSGTNAEWNVERALFPAQVCTFLDTRRCCTIQPWRESGRFPNPSFMTPRRRTSACRARPSG